MFLNEEFLKLYEKLSELNEAKADTQRLIDFAGEDLANRFLAIKHRLKAPENDLYYWIKNKKVDELEQTITNLEATKSATKVKKEIADRGAKLVGENDYWKVYHITTFEAAKKYGRDTKWCITGINDYGDKYWKQYTDTGVNFYFYIAKNEYAARGNDSKMALALYRNGQYEIFDQQDTLVGGIPNAPAIPGLPDVDTSINDYEFDGTAIPEELFHKIKSLIVKEGVTHLYGDDFANFSMLEKVVLPNSLKTIGDFTFYDCPRLKSIIIPSGVVSIGEHAFGFCTGLVSVEMSDSVLELGAYAFEQCENLANVELSANIEAIEECTFLGCEKLNNINIPTKAHKIGNKAFLNCYNIPELSIPHNVKVIEADAFNGCSNLRKLELAEGIEELKAFAFGYCTSLINVRLPDSIRSLDKDAFRGCHIAFDFDNINNY